MSSSVVNLSRKPQCSVITHMRVPIFQKVTNSGEFTSTDWKSPSPFFDGWNKLSEDSLYVIFSQYRSCDTTLGLRSDSTGRIFDGWKIFAQFTRNFRIRLNLFQLLSKVLPSAYAQCATSANPSWVTTHPCNHALPCKHLAGYGVHTLPFQFSTASVKTLTSSFRLRGSVSKERINF